MPRGLCEVPPKGARFWGVCLGKPPKASGATSLPAGTVLAPEGPRGALPGPKQACQVKLVSPRGCAKWQSPGDCLAQNRWTNKGPPKGALDRFGCNSRETQKT